MKKSQLIKKSGGVVLVLLMLFFASAAQAQNRTVRGKITDPTGEPVIGASVTIIGNNTGSISDLDGNYSISVPDKPVILRFSYVGCKTKQINLPKNKNVLNVTLEDETTMLEGTVVVGMGLRRDEKSLSSAYQKVDTEGMTETRDANFLNMLTGKVAGLQVTSNGPAGSASVEIRGVNSLTGNNQPLYVIDGVPIINNVETGELTLDYGNPAASLNPDDIESMTVLKGANAAAIYGSDASNGVIVITTKKASKKRGLGVTFSSNLQFSTLLEYPEYQNAYGTGQSNIGFENKTFNFMSNAEVAYDPSLPYGLPRLEYQNQRSWGMPMSGYQVVGRNGQLKSYSPANSLIDLYSTSHAWTNSISLEGASDVASVRLSYTNINSDDVMMYQNDQNRNIFNLRASVRPVKKLSVDVGVRYTNEKVDNRNHRNSDKKNPLYAVAWMPRDVSLSELTPWKNPDGTLISFPGGFVNPLWCLNEISNEDEKHWVLADITLNYEITNGLKLRLKGSIDYNQKNGYEFVNMYGGSEIENNDGKYKEFSENYRNVMYEALLSYDKRWKHFNVALSLGANSQDYTFKKINSQVDVLIVPDMKSLANNGGIMNSWQDYNAKKKQAVFGTASFGYNDYLYLDLTGRNDWSSTLPADNRSYFYSSVGMSAILTEAIKSIPKSILSFAKVRANYAKVGNDTGFDQLYDAYSYQRMFKGNPIFVSGTKKLNPNLKPESTSSYEVGAELKFLNNRIGIDFTYYTKTTKDQIINSQISNVSGFNEAVFNAGKIKNWGYELTLTGTPVKIKDFSWETSLNWAKNNSEVLELANGQDRIRLTGAEGVIDYYVEVGHSVGTIYAKMAKLDDNGNILCNASGIPIFETDQFLCDVSPDWIGGWRNSFRWKNISASVLIDFRKGGKLWSSTMHQGTRDGQTMQSLEGRDASYFSNVILGENDEERRGFLKPEHTVNGNAVSSANATEGVFVPYGDGRVKGVVVPNGVFAEGLREGMSLSECNTWVTADSYWMGGTDYNARYYLYDTDFIKLRELSVGYEFPRSLLSKWGNVIQSMKISFVGRNLGYIHKKTPKGLDPEASSSLGIIRGIERGFNLPTATYGFDFKVTF